MLRKSLLFAIAIILGINIYIFTKKSPTSSKFPNNHKFMLNTIKSKITSKSLEGKAVVIFFGCLNCSDICPTALSDIQCNLYLFK